MKRTLVKILLALVWAGTAAECAVAQTTTVTAPSGSIQMGGITLATGSAVFVPVDAYGHAIPIHLSGGGINVPAGTTAKALGYSCAITNGGLGSCDIPDEVASSPSGFSYNVTISDTTRFGTPTSGMSYTLSKVTGITGSAFRLDLYAPATTVPTIAALTFTNGSGSPTGACVVPALYTDTNLGGLYQCVGGGWVGISGGGGGSGMNQLTGDVIAGPGTGSVSATLKTVNGTPGTCGDATHVAQVTTDGKGRTTNCTAVPIAGGGGGGLPAQIFYATSGDTIAAIEAECSSLCTYVVTVPQTITLAADHTLSSNVQVEFKAGGQWTLAGGHVLTIPGKVTGTLNQHFAGSTLKFGASQATVPAEWFGAVADFNGTSGTDNTTALRAAAASLNGGQMLLQLGTYYTAGCAIAITTPGSGIRGVNMWIPGNPATTGSVIACGSPTADVVSFAGTPTATLTGAKFEYFTVSRTVAPSGTAKGFNLAYDWYVFGDHLISTDSIYDFYLVGVKNSLIQNSLALWGYGSVASATGNPVGFEIDSTANTGASSSNSTTLNNDVSNSNLGASGHVTGLKLEGGYINDLDVNGFASNYGDYGIYVNYTGSNGIDTNADIHFNNSVLDVSAISSIYVNNVTYQGLGTVEFDHSWIRNLPAGASVYPAVDIENSSGVNITGNELYGTANIITLNGSNNITVNNNVIPNSNSDSIVVNNTNSSNITGNTIRGGTAGSSIHLTGTSSFNSITGNSLSFATHGISLETGTVGNTGIETNSFSNMSGLPVDYVLKSWEGNPTTMANAVVNGGTTGYAAATSAIPGVSLNSGFSDSPGIRGYWGNNTNIGFNVSTLALPTTCTTAGAMRFVKNYGETGASVLGALDANGNICGFKGIDVTNGIGVGSAAINPGGTSKSISIQDSGFPQFILSNTTPAVDNRNSRLAAYPDGSLHWEFLNDAGTAAGGIVTIGRTGTTPTDFTLWEPLRSSSTTAPSGSCSVNGWVFSQDGKGSFCKSGTWEVVFAAP